jgi:hypothetical protein
VDQESVNRFLLGAAVMACFAAGLFFLRFWRKTRDRLFAIFAAAFWLMGLNWLALSFTDRDAEFRPALYLIRLLAFVLIIYAILEKNRTARPRRVGRMRRPAGRPGSTRGARTERRGHDSRAGGECGPYPRVRRPEWPPRTRLAT